MVLLKWLPPPSSNVFGNHPVSLYNILFQWTIHLNHDGHLDKMIVSALVGEASKHKEKLVKYFLLLKLKYKEIFCNIPDWLLPSSTNQESVIIYVCVLAIDM